MVRRIRSREKNLGYTCEDEPQKRTYPAAYKEYPAK